MRNLIAWILIVVGLVLLVGGFGMIIVGLLGMDTSVSLAGVGWGVVGAIATIPGFRLRSAQAKASRPKGSGT
jgi:hypothetical protein